MELWDTLIKVAGPLVPVLAAAITVYLRLHNRNRHELLPTTLPKTLRKNPRSRLKDDLQILKMLKDTDHPKYDVVRNHINTLVEKVYEQPSKEEGFKLKGPKERVLFVMGIMALMGFSFWTWSLVRDGFSGWAVGTGFGVLLGIMWIFFSYEERALPKDTKGDVRPPEGTGTK